MFQREILILNNKEIVSGYFLMQLESPEIARNSSPGQFLHIKCSPLSAKPTLQRLTGGDLKTGNNKPLLRRPFSIHRVIEEGIIEILYKVVGKGTHCLSRRKSGEKIDCIGPLGNGFQLSPKESDTQTLRSHRTTINYQPPTVSLIVAGGIGIAPLIFLTEKLAKLKIKNEKLKINTFLGAKTKGEILCTKKLQDLGAEVNIATEDGSLGYKGMVSELLRNKLSSIVHHSSSIVYACGPQGMLKETALISKEYKVPCQVSFEQFMGCGIGICNACVIRTKQGYKKVCRDGPVFDAEEIDWSKI